MKFATLAAPGLFVLVALSLTSCSKKEPTLEEIVDKADAEIKAGDQLAFIRLANNGLVQNATVQKVEDDFVLITTEEEDGSPYWINLASAVSYQQDSLVRRRRGKEVTGGQSESSIKLEEVSSIGEVIESLSKLDVQPPKKWQDLGILERGDWIARLTREAPDYVMAGSVVVSDVSEWWSLSIEGDFQLPKPVSQEITLQHLPMKATFKFRALQENLWVDSGSGRFPS